MRTETGQPISGRGLWALLVGGYLLGIVSLYLHRGSWLEFTAEASPLQALARSAPSDALRLLPLLALGLLIRRHHRPGALPPALFWGLLGIAALWLPTAVIQSGAYLDGQWRFWLIDDEMISMTYAKNLVQGQGLVWSPGERVEGFSNPLWTLAMAAVLLLAPLHLAPLVMLLVTVGIGAFMVVLTRRLALQLGGGEWSAGASVALLILAPFGLMLASAGWESVLLAALTLWAMGRIVEEQGQSPRWGTALLLGLIALVRVDATAVSLVLGLFWWFGSAARGRSFLLGLAALLLPLSWLLFRLGYYGEWLPNTVILKTAHWPDRVTVGLAYIAHYFKHVAPLLLLAAWAFWRKPRFGSLMIMTLAAVVIAQTAYSGGDVFGGYRMLFPVLMPLAALAFSRLEQSTRHRWARLAGPALCLLSMGLIFPGLQPRFGIASAADAGNVAMAMQLRTRCGDGPVADFYAGTPYYYSGCRGIDLLGKMDRHVAGQTVHPGSTHPGHNKFDYDWSLGQLRPAFVVAPEAGIPEASALDQMAADGWHYPGAFYRHPLFQRYCAPYPESFDSWRTVYRCQWPPAS